MRIVIKVGTQVIIGKRGLDLKKIGSLIDEISGALKHGHEVVLVSSGAIGAGLPIVHFTGPISKKIASAVGQPLLVVLVYAGGNFVEITTAPLGIVVWREQLALGR